MARDKDLSRHFASGFDFESQIITQGIYSGDDGYHQLGLKITHEGNSTNVDGVVTYGNVVILIEAKNYTLIEGNYNKDFWYGKGKGRRFSIFSPIKQNLYHAKFFLHLMARNNFKNTDIDIRKFIVVPDSCEIKVDKLSRGFIIHLSQFEMYKRNLRMKVGPAKESIINLIKKGE